MSFVRDDWALGVGKERLASLVLKWLADNELDAGGECRVGQGPLTSTKLLRLTLG